MTSNHSRTAFPAWDEAKAESLDLPGLLLYRSNLLGSDLRITNYGGGNTSAKIHQKDPLTGAMVPVLWVKGSGGDIGSMALEGFSTLYLDRLQALKALYKGWELEDEMVAYLPHCTFNLNLRAASIDTPLHAFLPFVHVDHMHPDAVIAIAAMENSQTLTEQVFGGSVGWIAWRRPGFELGLILQRYVEEHPGQRGLILAGHGLITWGADSRSCYENTVNVISDAQNWLEMQRSPDGLGSFGGPARQSLDSTAQLTILGRMLPVLRGLSSRSGAKVLHLDRQPIVSAFVNSREFADLASIGTSCPDHFLRTKIRPLVIDENIYQLEGAALLEALETALDGYRKEYTAYYDRCRRASSPPMRDANPVIVLIPGIGMVAIAKDKSTARIACEFYVNAINVMRDANGIDRYVGLPEQEAFDIEYWLLEEAKLKRLPNSKPLAGKVAAVTGGAGGIGMAIARRLLDEGACVVLADIDQPALESARAELAHRHGADFVRALHCDVTNEEAVIAHFEQLALEFGGIDILVSNAGIASAAPFDETSLALWHRTHDILSTGYFLMTREAFRMMKAQGLGGSIVIIGSKNGMVASANAAAYCTAKAVEIQLSRCLALEGAPLGIRSNVVNPDAVIRGSKIWTGKWSEERAAANNINKQDLEAFYRDRSLLKRAVYPEDIAEAAYFFAAESLSAKSTGNILNVDSGNVAAFTR